MRAVIVSMVLVTAGTALARDVLQWPGGPVAWDGSHAFHRSGAPAWVGGRAFHASGEVAWTGRVLLREDGGVAWSDGRCFTKDGRYVNTPTCSLDLGEGVTFQIEPAAEGHSCRLAIATAVVPIDC